MKMRSLLAGLVLVASGAAADPIEGVWRTETDDGSYAHVTMASCGAKLCGVISRTFNAQGEYASPNKGKVLVRDMAPTAAGKYEGKVWRPSNNKVYLGKMELKGNSLKLKGCVAGGLLCSSQVWSRVN